MTWWLVGAAWVACGVAEAGFNYAYFQRCFPAIADEMRQHDIKSSWLFSLFGPLALLASILSGMHKHGWLFPGSRP